MTKYQNTQHVKDATDTWYIYTYREKKFYFLHYSNKANSLLIFWLWIRGQVPPRPALRNRAFRKTWHRKAWLRTWQGHHKKTNYCLTCLRIRNRCWVLRIRCWPFQSRSRTPAKSKSWQMQIKRLKKETNKTGPPVVLHDEVLQLARLYGDNRFVTWLYSCTTMYKLKLKFLKRKRI